MTRKRTTKISCDDCQDCFSKTKQRDYERNTLQLAVGYLLICARAQKEI